MFKKMKQAERSRLLRRGGERAIYTREIWERENVGLSYLMIFMHFFSVPLSFFLSFFLFLVVENKGFGSDKELLEKGLDQTRSCWKRVWDQTSSCWRRIWGFRFRQAFGLEKRFGFWGQILVFIRMESWDMGGMCHWGVCLKWYFILFFFEDLGNRKWIYVR